jgi:hypothetical protein
MGFGRSANVSGELFVNDGKLRSLSGETIHSVSTCKQAYVDLKQKFS